MFTPYEMEKADERGSVEGHMGDAYVRTNSEGQTELWFNGAQVGLFVKPSEAMKQANFIANPPRQISIDGANV